VPPIRARPGDPAAATRQTKDRGCEEKDGEERHRSPEYGWKKITFQHRLSPQEQNVECEKRGSHAASQIKRIELAKRIERCNLPPRTCREKKEGQFLLGLSPPEKK
jgi:hypothetical protein